MLQPQQIMKCYLAANSVMAGRLVSKKKLVAGVDLRHIYDHWILNWKLEELNHKAFRKKKQRSKIWCYLHKIKYKITIPSHQGEVEWFPWILHPSWCCGSPKNGGAERQWIGKIYRVEGWVADWFVNNNSRQKHFWRLKRNWEMQWRFILLSPISNLLFIGVEVVSGYNCMWEETERSRAFMALMQGKTFIGKFKGNINKAK